VMILSFYSVVSGWSIGYLWRSAGGYLQGLNNAEIEQMWGNFLADPWEMLLWHTLFMGMTLWVVARGVEGGLEKLNTYLMPALFAILILLGAYSAYTGEFLQAVKFLFEPDFSKITPAVMLSALGQAFFSLALGAGMITVYAAYSQEKTSLTHSMSTIAILNVFVAILAGLAIFPIVFAYGLPVSEGPGLMYVVLPMAFAHMDYGMLVGALFFILLLFAAWTSSISLAEPVVYLLIERTRLTRIQATWLVCGFAWLLGIGSLLSFNAWAEVKFAGFTIFAMATDIPTNIILPSGGLLFALFVGWVMTRATNQEVLQMRYPNLFKAWWFIVRFVAPLAITIILVTSLLTMIGK
ncbi:MAG: sodium-dependent transporter, partial [Gammaproteobacteria bacterium]